MTLRETLLRDIDRFLKRTGMAETTFGQAALNDPALVRTIRAGRAPGADTIDAIHKYMAKNDVKKRRKARR